MSPPERRLDARAGGLLARMTLVQLASPAHFRPRLLRID
jgi:hypothetical protein